MARCCWQLLRREVAREQGLLGPSISTRYLHRHHTLQLNNNRVEILQRLYNIELSLNDMLEVCKLVNVNQKIGESDFITATKGVLFGSRMFYVDPECDKD